MDKRNFLKLIEKYNQGTCSREELEKLDRFCQELQQHPYPEAISSIQEEKLKESLYHRIETEIFVRPAAASGLHMTQIIKWAAVFFAIIGITSLFPLLLSQDVPLITESTGYGEQRTLLFEDGTTVYLSALSSITYPASFEDVRNVTLEGEAFFEVSKDASNPFIVESEALYTKVLGTSFGIKAYPDDETVEVTLATGKVLVSDTYIPSSDLTQADNKKSFVLHPKMMAVFLKNKDSMFVKQTDLKAVLARRNGTFYFDHEPLKQVVKSLSRHYDVRFEFMEERFEEIIISGEMKPDALPNLLENLQFLTGLEFNIDQKLITIQKPPSI